MWTNCHHNIFLGHGRSTPTSVSAQVRPNAVDEPILTFTDDQRLGIRGEAFRKQQKSRNPIQMMAEHGDLCSGQEATYCMNGGTCYKIASMNTLSCVCNDDYKGSRCEQFLLPTKISNSTEAGLIAAVVIITLLALVVLALLIYYIRRMMRLNQESKQSNQQQYWKVAPRV